MSDEVQYSVRDSYGNRYGPAPAALLRQWVGEGRIVSGMMIGPASGEGAWVEASVHPALTDLFRPTSAVVTAAESVQVSRMEYAQPARQSGAAVASLVLGIVGLVTALPGYPVICCCLPAIPLSVAGLFLGFLGLGQTRSATSHRTGRGMAIAGIVLSGLALLYMTLVTVGLVVAGAWSARWR